MEWATPKFRKGEVDWAGRFSASTNQNISLILSDEWSKAYDIISNWRSSHSYPLNTFQVTLRRRARSIDSKCIVAQRIKRLWSINHKLDRFSSMQLSQMQDIGGCRAILDTAQNVATLVESYQNSDLRHKLYKVTDYIDAPRSSGYRGIHLLWQYFSDKPSKSCYNGLRIEMQLRSALQHVWATAVETVGILTRQALKSSLGEAEWLRFFALMGSVIAIREGCALVPDTPIERRSLIAELRHHASRLNASNVLQAVGDALNKLEQINTQSAHFFLLELNPKQSQVRITGFLQSQSELAERHYLDIERHQQETKSTEGLLAVLVSVDNIAALRTAYPNYFLDTRVFAGVLNEALNDLK